VNMVNILQFSFHLKSQCLLETKSTTHPTNKKPCYWPMHQ